MCEFVVCKNAYDSAMDLAHQVMFVYVYVCVVCGMLIVQTYDHT